MNYVVAFNTFYMFETLFDKDFLYHSMFEEALHLYYNTNNALFVVTVNDSTSNNTYNKQSLLDKFWNSDYEESLDDKSPYQLGIAKDIITSWTARVGYPVVKVTQNRSTQNLDIRVIDCFDVDQINLCSKKWSIPVSFYKVTTTDIISSYRYYLSPTGISLVLPVFEENEFAIMANSSGYRVNYDRLSWRNIAIFLKNSKITHADLPEGTLAQIFDDAFYFLVQNTRYNDRSASNLCDVDIYFDIASSLFRVDRTLIVWFPVLFALENLSNNFLFPDRLSSQHFKDRLLELLNKFLDGIEDLFALFSSENSVSNHFYHEVLKWTCILGGSKCNDHVNVTLEFQFNHPAQTKLMPSWQKWLYCQSLRIENVTYDFLRSEIWKTLVNTYAEQSKATELFEFFPCSRNKENFLNYIYTLTDDTPTYFILPGNINVSEKDTVTLMFNMFAKHSKDNDLLSSILQALMRREINLNIVGAVSCIINNIYSHDGLSMVTNETFLEKLMDLHRMPLFVLDAIKRKARFRDNFLRKQHFSNWRSNVIYNKYNCTDLE